MKLSGGQLRDAFWRMGTWARQLERGSWGKRAALRNQTEASHVSAIAVWNFNAGILSLDQGGARAAPSLLHLNPLPGPRLPFRRRPQLEALVAFRAARRLRSAECLRCAMMKSVHVWCYQTGCFVNSGWRHSVCLTSREFGAWGS